MYIHRYYNAAGPTAEALLLQAFMLYLAGRANAAQTEPPAHTGARA